MPWSVLLKLAIGSIRAFFVLLKVPAWTTSALASFCALSFSLLTLGVPWCSRGTRSSPVGLDVSLSLGNLLRGTSVAELLSSRDAGLLPLIALELLDVSETSVISLHWARVRTLSARKRETRHRWTILTARRRRPWFGSRGSSTGLRLRMGFGLHLGFGLRIRCCIFGSLLLGKTRRSIRVRLLVAVRTSFAFVRTFFAFEDELASHIFLHATILHTICGFT